VHGSLLLGSFMWSKSPAEGVERCSTRNAAAQRGSHRYIPSIKISANYGHEEGCRYYCYYFCCHFTDWNWCYASYRHSYYHTTTSTRRRRKKRNAAAQRISYFLDT